MAGARIYHSPRSNSPLSNEDKPQEVHQEPPPKAAILPLPLRLSLGLRLPQTLQLPLQHLLGVRIPMWICKKPPSWPWNCWSKARPTPRNWHQQSETKSRTDPSRLGTPTYTRGVRTMNATTFAGNAKIISNRLVLRATNAYILRHRSSERGFNFAGRSIRLELSGTGPTPSHGLNLRLFSKRVSENLPRS